jgi:hypothetical protein
MTLMLFFPFRDGSPSSLYHVDINHILLLLILLAFPHGLPDHRFMLQFVLTAPPQDHEPSISSTISLPLCEPIFISPTSYRNSPMGPPPFISFPRNFCPPWGIHSTLGHPFLYFVHLSHIYLLFLVQTPFITSLCFCRHRWRPAFLLATRNPCHPWIGAVLIIYPCRHRPYLQSTPQVSYLYPLNLFTLSRLWHNLALVLSSP